MADAELLYQWRLQQEAQPWYISGRTGFEEHCDWLEQRLTGPCMILIWETDQPTGMVRVESDGSISFHGDNPDMLAALTALRHLYGGRLKATLDADDPRAAQLEAAGFVEYEARAMIYKEET